MMKYGNFIEVYNNLDYFLSRSGSTIFTTGGSLLVFFGGLFLVLFTGGTGSVGAVGPL